MGEKWYGIAILIDLAFVYLAFIYQALIYPVLTDTPTGCCKALFFFDAANRLFMEHTLPIVYQDSAIVVVYKPSGLLVHRSPIDKRETTFALQILRDQMGCRVYPAHRLDKPTSGLLLFGLTAQVAQHLGRQFMAGQVSKQYVALVRGHCETTGVIDHPLRDEVDTNGVRTVGEVFREARTAITPLAQWILPLAVDRYPEARYSLVSLQPYTGRFRQIRRHLKHISHPIIGDTRYGKGTHNRFFREHFASHRLLLAATELRLTHPVSGQDLHIKAPLAEDFCRVLRNLDELSSSSRRGVATHRFCAPERSA